MLVGRRRSRAPFREPLRVGGGFVRARQPVGHHFEPLELAAEDRLVLGEL
jgi:hypothetical protein